MNETQTALRAMTELVARLDASGILDTLTGRRAVKLQQDLASYSEWLETARSIDAADFVVMRFIDAPMGCRFRYKTSNPSLSRTWIKLGIDGTGIIGEYDSRWMQTKNWHGQQVCSFADTEEQMRSMEIEVLG